MGKPRLGVVKQIIPQRSMHGSLKSFGIDHCDEITFVCEKNHGLEYPLMPHTKSEITYGSNMGT